MSDEDFQRELENVDLSQPDGWTDTPADLDEPEPERKEEKKEEPKKRVRASRAKATKAGTDADLEAKLREPLLRIGEWLSRRNPELSEALKEDAPKMARLLARWALNAKTPAGVVTGIRLAAAALEPIDAFARVIRLAVFALYDWRASRRPQQAVNDYPEVEPDMSGAEPDYVYPDNPPQPDDAFAEARERFLADREPPVVND